MLQRIQTVFLLIVTAVNAALFLIPFVEYSSAKSPLFISLMPQSANPDINAIFYLPVTLNIISMVFSVFIIMQYRRRIPQMKMAYVLMAFNVILLGSLLLFDFAKPTFAGNASAKNYLYGTYLPIISVLVCFLAARAIKKDEELVRSADRLR